MKRAFVFLLSLYAFVWTGKAQSLTIEYNVGHGLYQMSDMKDLLEEMSLPVVNTQVTDNFPGYVTQDTRLGVEWRRHHVGALFNYMNTAGKRGVADYSGSCYYQLRGKGYKLGAFYRFRLVDEAMGRFTFEPYVQLSTGVVLNRTKESDWLDVISAPELGYRNEYLISGHNFFVEPAFGIKFGLCRQVALNVSIAYEWDAVKQEQQSLASDFPKNFKVDWSGYRAQAGLIFYLDLKK